MATAEAVSPQGYMPIRPGSLNPTILVLLTLLGVPVTGVTTGTAGLAISYLLTNSAGVVITPTVIAGGVTGPWQSGGFIELDSVKHPGYYRLDLPTLAVITPGVIMITVLTSVAADPCYYMANIGDPNLGESYQGGMNSSAPVDSQGAQTRTWTLKDGSVRIDKQFN